MYGECDQRNEVVKFFTSRHLCSYKSSDNQGSVVPYQGQNDADINDVDSGPVL